MRNCDEGTLKKYYNYGNQIPYYVYKPLQLLNVSLTNIFNLFVGSRLIFHYRHRDSFGYSALSYLIFSLIVQMNTSNIPFYCFDVSTTTIIYKCPYCHFCILIRTYHVNTFLNVPLYKHLDIFSLLCYRLICAFALEVNSQPW